MTPRTVVIAEIDEAELTVRMIEAHGECVRPHPDPRVSLAGIDSPDLEAWARIVRVTMTYLQECINGSARPN